MQSFEGAQKCRDGDKKRPKVGEVRSEIETWTIDFLIGACLRRIDFSLRYLFKDALNLRISRFHAHPSQNYCQLRATLNPRTQAAQVNL
ncbi:hypothetical protein GCM10011273_18020 [Asticcacaulis endophyticus]|uniref:Uncharacterized protein n=1 Tax=Asticcacaulis endophyticus TaxID=1395890 RepID=A0A918USN2_9CAUL|nr:hypothetical protein GCM10011273_18020 [Asticcacaulis endophyticus]